MSWNENTSRQRVRAFMREAPEIKGALPDYAGGDLRAKQRSLRALGANESNTTLDRLAQDTAIVVDGVHVYVRLLGFDELLSEQARETEASHRRALQSLHFYYVMLDRIVREGGGVRVDFHSARMHFVVAEPVGRAYAAERVEIALQIAEALGVAASQAPSQLGYGAVTVPLRVGVDEGPCIAIANDSGHELDPVFLGSPANYAAKLAEGPEAGIFVSPAVRKLLGMMPLALLADAHNSSVPAQIRSRIISGATGLATRATDRLLEQKKQNPGEIAPPHFVFRSFAPPLAQIKFAELMPSNSIRIDAAALFADLDRFTAYVDQALKAGAGREVVRTMFVIREEQRAVLKQDFRSKRLRFVGDCVIGLHAEGTAQAIDAAKTVETAVTCAAALHNSLDVCREEMPAAEPLGLQVGVAFGPTPITRLGIRGDMSVRCAASRAVVDAEKMQGRAARGETVVSEAALAVSARVRKLAGAQRSEIKGKFAAVDALLSGAPLALGSTNTATATTSSRPTTSAPPFRAHSKS